MPCPYARLIVGTRHCRVLHLIPAQYSQCPMPNAQCPMPNSQFPMPNAYVSGFKARSIRAKTACSGVISPFSKR